MTTPLFEIDPVSESQVAVPLNVPLSLVGQVGNVKYGLVDFDITPPDIDAITASSADTEGDPFVDSHEHNRTVSLTIFAQATTDRFLEIGIQEIQQKIGKLRRERGTLKFTTQAGTELIADVNLARFKPEFSKVEYGKNRAARFTLEFDCAPYFRGLPFMEVVDDFSTNTIANYTFDSGAGTIAISGGQLVPSSTATKVFYHSVSPYPFCDVWVQGKVVTGASVASGSFACIARRLDSLNYLMGFINFAGAATTVVVGKVDGGAFTSLQSSGAFTPLAATSYWIRFRLEGNLIAIEFFTAAPGSAAPTQTAVATLAGADATKFGVGIEGRCGFQITPQATDYRYDDFAIIPNQTVERTLPVLQLVARKVRGDVPALGQLSIVDFSGVDQWSAVFGLQSRYYDTAASADLFYEAEALTAMGGSAIAAGPSGASGGGSNVMRNLVLTTNYQAILSTQLTGGGAHLSHIGTFRVYARVQTPTTNTGAVSVALEWGEGDFRRFTRNADTTFPVDAWDATWRVVDLGLVTLTKAAQGVQRWEGRILAKSTIPSDDIDIDCLWLQPTEVSGSVKAVSRIPTPTAFVARDEFDQTAGALTGKTAPVGGVWAGAGDADDFTVETAGHTAQRTAILDTNLSSGRYAISGASALAGQLVQIDAKHDLAGPNDELRLGVLARYTDTSNFVLLSAADATTVYLVKKVAGVETVLWSTNDPNIVTLVGNTFYTFRVYIDAAGRWAVWVYGSTWAPFLRAIGQDAALATGGALATGKPGFYDSSTNSTVVVRNYDNFLAWVPPADAAIFGGQWLQIRHNRRIRLDSTGLVWQEPSSYEGDPLLIPPAAKENRSSRIIIKASRGDLSALPDGGIDDITAQLTYTPRYLALPA
jgi:hypothetical protein